MSCHDAIVNLKENVASSSSDPTPEPHMDSSKEPQHGFNGEEKAMLYEEEEMAKSAHLEPSTLPYPGDRSKKFLSDQDDGISGPDDKRGGSQELSEVQSQTESDMRSKSRWRESMPEGDRWREIEIKSQQDSNSDNSLADDEEEEEHEELQLENTASGFTPNVMIVNPCGKDAPEEKSYRTETYLEELRMERGFPERLYSDFEEQDNKYYIYEQFCSEKLRLVFAVLAAGLVFPLLVWGGFAFLPFDSPLLDSPPLRVVYTLRCAFFAIIPILLGVVVQGVARLRHSSLKPLYQTNFINKEVIMHWHYINESLTLFIFYFLQLAVMATYISQDLVKLVPLLSIIFVFGRLIYWLCLSFGSTIRGFGFGFSFFPILVMLGANLYYVCSSDNQGSIFDVAPPTTPPAPVQRWWG